eukprot:6779223-Heterocapsa_arctica.AAC.2
MLWTHALLSMTRKTSWVVLFQDFDLGVRLRSSSSLFDARHYPVAVERVPFRYPNTPARSSQPR